MNNWQAGVPKTGEDVTKRHKGAANRERSVVPALRKTHHGANMILSRMAIRPRQVEHWLGQDPGHEDIGAPKASERPPLRMSHLQTMC
jgi:hypothetical protein